jgi:hypothetical protein
MVVMLHRVNFDYDQALLKGDAKFEAPKLNMMFEYIYFLVNQNPSNQLYNYQEYEKEYLAYLKSKGFVIPNFSKAANYSNWWADISDIEKCRKIESKVVTTELALKNNLCPSDLKIVKNLDELYKYLDSCSSVKNYYRSEFGFSGTGNKIVYKDKKYSLRYPGVIAPYFKTILSFGVSVDLLADKYYLIRNDINENGVFLGGEILELEDLARALSLEEEEIDKEIRKIMRVVEDEFGKINFQFDSLIYEQEDSVHWYRLVEINFRRTMGEVIKCLTDRFGQGKWHIIKNDLKYKDYLELEKYLEGLYSRKIVVTSPLNHKLMSFFAY